MKTNDLNNPETAQDLPAGKREIIKQMQADYKAFNEQQKLYDRLHGTLYTGYINPNLLDAFIGLRNNATAERLGGNAAYFKLMRITSFEGLSFHEIAQVFNYVETCTALEYFNAVSPTADAPNAWCELLEDTYNNSAMAVWNKQVDVWKEEIAIEKQELVKKINAMVTELNADIKSKKKKSHPAPLNAAYTKKSAPVEPANN